MGDDARAVPASPSLRVTASVPSLPDCDLSRLAPEDIARVRRWAEDRILNAITPLSYRLQLAPPWAIACDKTLLAATRAVERLENIVAEVRDLRSADRRGEDPALRASGPGGHPVPAGARIRGAPAAVRAGRNRSRDAAS